MEVKLDRKKKAGISSNPDFKNYVKLLSDQINPRL